VTVAGHAIANADDLGQAIDSLHPGDRIDIAIIRGGHHQSVTLTVGQRPAANG
jgi:S1-C subfamily serine protease